MDGWMDGWVGVGLVIYTASVRLWRLKDVRNWVVHSSGPATDLESVALD